MKLFMVMYIWGNITGVAGPLLYDLYECQTRATSAMLEYQLKHTLMKEELQKPENYVQGKPLTRDALRFVCEYHEERSEIEAD